MVLMDKQDHLERTASQVPQDSWETWVLSVPRELQGLQEARVPRVTPASRGL